MRRLILPVLLCLFSLFADAQEANKTAGQTPIAPFIVSPKSFQSTFGVSINLDEKKDVLVQVLDANKKPVFESDLKMVNKTGFKVTLDDKPSGKYKIVFIGSDKNVLYAETITKQ